MANATKPRKIVELKSGAPEAVASDRQPEPSARRVTLRCAWASKESAQEAPFKPVSVGKVR